MLSLAVCATAAPGAFLIRHAMAWNVCAPHRTHLFIKLIYFNFIFGAPFRRAKRWIDIAPGMLIRSAGGRGWSGTSSWIWLKEWVRGLALQLCAHSTVNSHLHKLPRWCAPPRAPLRRYFDCLLLLAGVLPCQGALDKKIDLRNGCRISLCGKITFYFSAGVLCVSARVREQAKANMDRQKMQVHGMLCVHLPAIWFDQSALDFGVRERKYVSKVV